MIADYETRRFMAQNLAERYGTISAFILRYQLKKRFPGRYARAARAMAGIKIAKRSRPVDDIDWDAVIADYETRRFTAQNLAERYGTTSAFILRYQLKKHFPERYACAARAVEGGRTPKHRLPSRRGTWFGRQFAQGKTLADMMRGSGLTRYQVGLRLHRTPEYIEWCEALDARRQLRDELLAMGATVRETVDAPGCPKTSVRRAKGQTPNAIPEWVGAAWEYYCSDACHGTRKAAERFGVGQTTVFTSFARCYGEAYRQQGIIKMARRPGPPPRGGSR